MALAKSRRHDIDDDLPVLKPNSGRGLADDTARCKTTPYFSGEIAIALRQ